MIIMGYMRRRIANWFASLKSIICLFNRPHQINLMFFVDVVVMEHHIWDISFFSNGKSLQKKHLKATTT